MVLNIHCAQKTPNQLEGDVFDKDFPSYMIQHCPDNMHMILFFFHTILSVDSSAKRNSWSQPTHLDKLLRVSAAHMRHVYIQADQKSQ